MGEMADYYAGHEIEALAARHAKEREDGRVSCRLCGEMTRMESTKLCDRCWELERRIERDPSIAAAILIRIMSKKK